MSEAVTLSIISLISTVILGYFTYLNNREKIRQDSEIAILKDTVCDQQGEINALKDANTKLTKNYRSLWMWTLALLEHMKKKNVKPLPPPDDLQSDPELARLVMFEPRKSKQPKRKVGK